MKKEAVIKIKLKSDLCMGSGYSYAGIIDSDICYDENGIPYIPAKRLKGCFRDTAENVLYSIITEEKIEKIFGKAGSKAATGIFLDNAYIENYDIIKEELEKFRIESENEISQQDVLNMFTHIKAQTKLENGVAKDTALRYTRVTNQYSPLGEHEELTFYAKVIYESDDEEQLAQIITATRNIGLHRNRGLGSVRCEFPISSQEIKEINKEEVDRLLSESDEQVVISYVIENVQPLMLSSSQDMKSDKYICGKTMLGFLAGKYLEIEGTSAEDEVFKDLFLRGETIFTNAVPSKYIDEKSVRVYYPAPEYINKLKKTKKLVNTHFIYEGEETEYNPEKGNIPKKLKDKFVACEDGKVDVTDVNMKIIYHHSEKAKSKNDENGQLFGLTAIKENQYFSGEIYVKQKYAGLLEKIIRTNAITLGKSKSSQYGKCILKKMSISKVEKGHNAFSKGQYIVVTLLSDCIFMNDYAEYTVYSDEVKQLVAKSLGIQYETDNQYSDMIQTKEIVGYQSQWNLRKAPAPAIKAGSCLVYKLTEDIQITANFIGERNLEGYGQVMITSMENMKYVVDEISETDKENHISSLNKTKELVRDILVDKVIEKLKLEGINQETYKITTSNLGRITLMLKESIYENKDDYKEAFEEFAKRVESIKTDSIRREIRDVILEKFGKKKRADESSPREYTWTFSGIKKDGSCEKELQMLKDIGCDEVEMNNCVNSQWGEVLMTILVSQKYAMKGEK
jgi:CRISPR-associated protein Csx10